MGRKPIAPSQRAQPISFSLKPHLIAKIDDYAGDMRFSRSKFLMQAVTEYMTRNIVNPNDVEFSSNTNDMTLTQKVAVGLEALKQANMEGETISAAVIKALKRELGVVDSETPKKAPSVRRIIDVKRLEAGEYNVFDARTFEQLGHIYKDSNRTERPWVFSNHLNGENISSRTLADAKDVAQEELEG